MAYVLYYSLYFLPFVIWKQEQRKVIMVAEPAARQTRTTAQVQTPGPDALTRSKSARQGGSERTCSSVEDAAASVGRALEGYLAAKKGLVACDDEKKRPEAEEALRSACTGLLDCIADMNTLQRAEKTPKLVERALRALDSEREIIKNADPKLVERGRALLACINARRYIDYLVTRDDLTDGQRERPEFLARALGEIALLRERGTDSELVYAALETIRVPESQDWAKPRDLRAALAARLMEADVTGDAVPIPEDMVEGARENLASRVANVNAAAGSHKRWKGLRSLAIQELAEAYADMVVLQRACWEKDMESDPGQGLLIKALDLIINTPPCMEKKLAAELMRSRLN